MATADAIQDLATKLASELTTAEAVPLTFSQEFAPTFRWLPLYDLEDLNSSFVVSLVPDSEQRDRSARHSFTGEWVVAMIVQTHGSDDLAAVSAAAELAKEIRQWIEANAASVTLDGGTRCRLMSLEVFLPGRRALKNQRLIAAGANLTYRVGG